MSLRKDKVSDVIAVLNIMKELFRSASRYCITTEVRKVAVSEYAARELSVGRFKNVSSSVNTIHDACARRLRPDIDNIEEFDEFVDQWRHGKSTKLKEILLGNANGSSQRILVTRFFE
jgi:hypothetical protein